jgi:hypothetical protein
VNADILTHDDADARDCASRYVADTLNSAERVAFEVHLLECERCRAEVELASGVRTAVRGSRRLIWIIGLAAAAGIVAAAVMLSGRTESDEIRALGTVAQAPMYLGVAVRAEAASAPRGALQFDSAMAVYNRADYARAAAELRAALTAGSAAVPTNFFLGASLLMLDRPAEARAAFTHVIDDGESPYWYEAHFYRAKSALREADVRAARADLEILARQDSPMSSAARDLLARLNGALKQSS